MGISAGRERYEDLFQPLSLALAVRNIAGRLVQSLANAASQVKGCGPGRHIKDVNTIYCEPRIGLSLLKTVLKDR